MKIDVELTKEEAGSLSLLIVVGLNTLLENEEVKKINLDHDILNDTEKLMSKLGFDLDEEIDKLHKAQLRFMKQFIEKELGE